MNNKLLSGIEFLREKENEAQEIKSIEILNIKAEELVNKTEKLKVDIEKLIEKFKDLSVSLDECSEEKSFTSTLAKINTFLDSSTNCLLFIADLIEECQLKIQKEVEELSSIKFLSNKKLAIENPQVNTLGRLKLEKHHIGDLAIKLSEKAIEKGKKLNLFPNKEKKGLKI